MNGKTSLSIMALWPQHEGYILVVAKVVCVNLLKTVWGKTEKELCLQRLLD